MTAWVLDQILRLLHPFTPFVTEELWRLTASEHEQGTPTGAGVRKKNLLALADWPRHDALHDPQAEAEIGWVIDLVSAVRSLRAEMNIATAVEIPAVLVGVSTATHERAGRWDETIRRLARLSDISMAPAAPPGAVALIVRGEIAALPLAGIIDVAAEQARLEKDMGRVDSDLARIDAKLANADFLRRAPEEVVEGEREKRAEAATRRAKINEALERLKSVA
jgi:valyl-tRNA synthetase